MVMQYSEIRSKIKARLDTISGLVNYVYEPDAIGQVPFSILGSGDLTYDTDMGGGRDLKFRLLLCVAERESPAAWTALDTYLGTESGSIKYALEGSSEAAPSVGDFCSISKAENIGHLRYRERTFIGAEIIISVQSGG